VLAESLTAHLETPLGRGHTPVNSFTGAAGGAACGDLVRVSLALGGEGTNSPEGTIADAGFDASGCGATIAAGSAAVALVRGTPLLQAARVGPEEIAVELGGLSPAKHHAAELAADALHRALGAMARGRGGPAHPILAAPSGAPPTRRVFVAMSGGVDSAVAALLTAREGEEVVAVTLELWADPENDGERSCCSAQAVRGARALAHRLGLPHLSIDLREEFRAGVVDGWLAGYARGHTPNPCVRCNGSVRLDAMLDLAHRLGGERLVTGHYARVNLDGPTPLLRMALDPVKDQSYVLAGLAPDSLARLRFPLGGMTKTQVRELAAREGLAVARKPDSQDLCFLAGTGLSRFLARHGGGSVPTHPTRPAGAVARGGVVREEGGSGDSGGGSVLDLKGRRLGTHRGAHAFTVGQRHGLGIGGPEPLYVLRTDPRADTVTVGPREALLTSTVAVRDVTLRRPGARVDGVKVRSRGRRHPCCLADELGTGAHAAVEVQLREPIERTAPGQIACLYEGDVILGYGTVVA
jgi:tRNA-specific 2-thiouridylase